MSDDKLLNRSTQREHPVKEDVKTFHKKSENNPKGSGRQLVITTPAYISHNTDWALSLHIHSTVTLYHQQLVQMAFFCNFQK